MHTSNILVREQFAFGQGKSINIVFKLKKSTLFSINKKLQVGVIFCDVAKL
jgi:hypothetical protein